MNRKNATVIVAPMSATPSAAGLPSRTEQPLTLQQVLTDLADDGLVAREAAAKLLADRRGRVDVHPLVVVADQK